MKKPDRARRVDMSPEAIDRRLRSLGGMYRLGMALARARRLGPVEPVASPEQPDAPPPVRDETASEEAG